MDLGQKIHLKLRGWYEDGDRTFTECPIHITRQATPSEKQGFLEHARGYSTERKTKDELYALAKSRRLINPFKGGAVSIIVVANNYPETLVKTGKANELTSKLNP